jgi:hypothetical protein
MTGRRWNFYVILPEPHRAWLLNTTYASKHRGHCYENFYRSTVQVKHVDHIRTNDYTVLYVLRTGFCSFSLDTVFWGKELKYFCACRVMKLVTNVPDAIPNQHNSFQENKLLNNKLIRTTFSIFHLCVKNSINISFLFLKLCMRIRNILSATFNTSL